MNRARKERLHTNEISEVCEVTLGGYRQKIMLDGKKRGNPVVLCLHGGPGSPIPFCVGCRGMFPEITEKFILVCWDQLGCGINQMPIGDSFTVNDFVGMTVDLIKLLRGRFPENPLILFGMSWGSILTLKAADRAADFIDGAVTYGQVIDKLGFNDAVFSALARSALPKKKKALLEQMKKSPSVENGGRIMAWIRKYTDGYVCRSAEKKPMGETITGLLTSPDYRLRDVKALVVNGYGKNRSLLRELFEIDLKAELSRVKIPYTIIQGSADLVTPTALVKPFVLQSGNEKIRFVEAEKSGHIPNESVMKKIVGEIERLSKR